MFDSACLVTSIIYVFLLSYSDETLSGKMFKSHEVSGEFYHQKVQQMGLVKWASAGN